jgi:predicted transglutaminase-like cysteine proteinase
MRVTRLMWAVVLVGLTASPATFARSGSNPNSAQAAVPVDGRPDLFGSVALPVGRSRFSERWQRVFRHAAAPQLSRLVQPARSLGRAEQAQFVNASINRTIAYRFDTDASGDQWATVSETLGRGSGDCEDFVIAKMQALRALGVPAGNLYMTIGHDGSAGSVHALLLVRTDEGFRVLDNRTDRMIAPETYRDFHPILTFSGSRTWLHGYRPGAMPAAVRTMDLALNSRDLPLGDSAGSASPPRARR